MSKMQECHVAEAQRMRLAGHSWRMIGRAFGIRAITLKQVPASNPLGPRTAEIVPVSLPYLHFLYGGESLQIVEKAQCA
ncbi:hypothetical protein ACFFTN_01315 [Aminobacter aganoensis]|uniref:Uncharacterized protein n=1 Tax=Aminobacter aganoensis TaxID=83264 RepID=A0A7X0KJX7_9HYPH|nr:hypothetical protein [Aminobacter aganoensis]MBB6353502.1 hypothetical protein [Aminobacter aganoensis]